MKLSRFWKTVCSPMVSWICVLTVVAPALSQYNPSQGGSPPRSSTTSTGRRAQYTPPRGGSPPRSSTTSTGRRGGCSNDQSTSLTPIAPQTHVGQTSSDHPTFIWYVPDAEAKIVEFYLNEYGSNNQLTPVYQKTDLQSTPGLMSLTLPADQPGLKPGHTYSWTVALLCDPNHPSSAAVAKSEIKVVEMPPAVAASLNSVTSPTERANLFAENGLWYDAIDIALKAADRSLQSALIQELIRSEQGSPTSNHTNQLQQIVRAL